MGQKYRCSSSGSPVSGSSTDYNQSTTRGGPLSRTMHMLGLRSSWIVDLASVTQELWTRILPQILEVGFSRGKLMTWTLLSEWASQGEPERVWMSQSHNLYIRSSVTLEAASHHISCWVRSWVNRSSPQSRGGRYKGVHSKNRILVSHFNCHLGPPTRPQ